VLNPLDRYKRFQIIHPPFLDFAWRKGSFMLAPREARLSASPKRFEGFASVGSVWHRKRHCRDDLLLVRFQRKAHIAGRAIYSVRVETDPQRSLAGQIC